MNSQFFALCTCCHNANYPRVRIMHGSRLCAADLGTADAVRRRSWNSAAAPDAACHPTLTCAVERRDLPAGVRPARRHSLPPVAIGAVVEVTKRLKPSV